MEHMDFSIPLQGLFSEWPPLMVFCWVSVCWWLISSPGLAGPGRQPILHSSGCTFYKRIDSSFLGKSLISQGSRCHPLETLCSGMYSLTSSSRCHFPHCVTAILPWSPRSCIKTEILSCLSSKLLGLRDAVP